MTDETNREPDQIRRDCIDKLRPVQVSGIFNAMLSWLLGQDWATPGIEDLRITPDHGILARMAGEISHRLFLDAEADLIRNIHSVAKIANLNGDEVGYLLGRLEEIKRIQ